jgi:hypothetical protein
MGRPHIDPAASQLLQGLLAVLPVIRARLGVAGAFEGMVVHEPGEPTTYTRLVCRQALEWRQRVLMVGIHHFPGSGQGRMHDHRWPLAVWPFALDADNDQLPLYEMPWEHWRDQGKVAQGALSVHHGQAWAIESPREVRHAVHSHRPHGSINVTDVTNPPTRDNRLQVERLDETATESRRRMLLPWARRAAGG